VSKVRRQKRANHRTHSIFRRDEIDCVSLTPQFMLVDQIEYFVDRSRSSCAIQHQSVFFFLGFRPLNRIQVVKMLESNRMG